MMTRNVSMMLVGCMAFLMMTANLLAAPPSPQEAAGVTDPATALRDRILNAYAQAKTFSAKVEFTVNQNQGRWANIRQTWYTVAYERPDRFALDHPDYKLVVDKGQLRAVLGQVSGHHVEQPVTKLDYQALTDGLPRLFGNPPLPAVVMLLSPEPMGVLSGLAKADVKLAASDENHPRAGLTFADQDGSVWTIWPEANGLIREVVLQVDATHMGGKPGDSVSVSYKYPDAALDGKLPDDAFALDTTNSVAVDSLQALARAASSQRQQHASVGKPAPKLVLPTLEGKQFNLADVKEKVVILDFWATWCGPCRINMEILQMVKAWADKENKSLAIYTVDIMETPEQVKQFIKQTGMTLPVLMDADGAVAKAYGIGPIPHTAILKDGKVVEVHQGVNPETMEATLKKEIEELLGAEGR